MKKLIVGFAVAAAMAATGMAAAESMEANDQSTTIDSGIVVGGNLGYSYTYGADTPPHPNSYAPYTLSSFSKGGFAWGVEGGYQINRYLAVLLGYENFSEIQANLAGVSGSVDTKISNVSVSAKGIFPINAQFNLFGLVGAADMFQDFTFVNNGTTIGLTNADGNAWTAQLGAGIGYKVTPNVELALEDIYDFKTNYKKTFNGVSNTIDIPAVNSVLASVSYTFSV